MSTEETTVRLGTGEELCWWGGEAADVMAGKLRPLSTTDRNRNRTHFQASLYFHCGGLDLYPRPNT